MRSLIIAIVSIFSGVVIAGETTAWYKLTKLGSLYSGKDRQEKAGAYTPDVTNDEYPDGYAFPTNAPMYWKKVGNDIVAMTPAEQAVVNSNLQTEVTVATTGDAQMDAILRTIAEAIKNNEKTYEGVVAIFKGQVDPKKVKDKNK